jgi:hypothetical protein
MFDGDGKVTAYAALIDARTNDPTYCRPATPALPRICQRAIEKIADADLIRRLAQEMEIEVR